MPDLELTQADHGRSITVTPGQQVVIRLPEAPTTGFEWTLDGLDAAVVELLKSDYTAPIDHPVGGSGSRVWTLRAKGPGTIHLLAKRRRAWQGEHSSAESFNTTIQVGP